MVLSMDRWKGHVAIVTGASSGIGAALTKRLLEEGLIVVGFARRCEKIKELADSPNLHAIKVDLTKEEDILNAFKWVKENLGPIHILVNSAGISRLTNIIDGNSEMWREVMDTNFLSMCLTTRESVRNMRENNISGHIVNIASIGSHKVIYFPRVNVQPCSKFAVKAFADILRQEFNSISSQIKVSNISPGFVDTQIFEATAVGSGMPEYVEIIKKLVERNPFLDANDVVDAIIYVLSTAPHVQVHELIIKPVGEQI